MFGKLKNIFKTGEDEGVKIAAPMGGRTISLQEVNDPAFSEEMFGKGLAMRPIAGHLVSPVNGRVNQMFGTGHAVSLISDDGAEILIHIGLDTVKLRGQHFTPLVKTGGLVKTGDALIDFDIEAIKAAGYDIITPVVVCNSNDYKQFDLQTGRDVAIGEEIMTLRG